MIFLLVLTACLFLTQRRGDITENTEFLLKKISVFSVPPLYLCVKKFAYMYYPTTIFLSAGLKYHDNTVNTANTIGAIICGLISPAAICEITAPVSKKNM